jgi:hypothetical protein
MMLTDKDPVIGWEAIGATTHPQRRETVLAERAWATRDDLIEKGWFDHDGLEALADIASKLEIAKTSDADALFAHAVNILQEIKE